MVDDIIKSRIVEGRVEEMDEEETIEKGAVQQWQEAKKEKDRELKPIPAKKLTLPTLKFANQSGVVMTYEIVDEPRLPTVEDAFEAGWQFSTIEEVKVHDRTAYNIRVSRPKVMIVSRQRYRRYRMPMDMTDEDIKKLQGDLFDRESNAPLPFDLKTKKIFYILKAREEGKAESLPGVPHPPAVQQPPAIPLSQEDEVAQLAAQAMQSLEPAVPMPMSGAIVPDIEQLPMPLPEVAVETASEFHPRRDPLIGYTRVKGNPVPVFVKPVHVLIVGLTRNSGKTTTMEGYLSRMTGKRIVIFLLKRGEDVFINPKYNKIRPFIRTSTSWRDIQSVIEDEFKEKNRAIRPELIAITKLMMEQESETKTLRDIYNVVTYLVKNPANKKGGPSGALLQLWGYLGEIVEKLEKIKDLSEELALQNGINVMDLRGVDDSVQGLIVASVAHEVLDTMRDVILYVPEAHKIIPKSNAPAKRPLERLIREGGVLGNNVYIDSQDITALDTPVIRSIDTVLIGKQQEDNELQKALSNLPVGQIPSNSLQRLKLGQFFLVHNGEVRLIFAVPPWMTQEQAILCCDDPGYVYVIAKQREQAKMMQSQGILKE